MKPLKTVISVGEESVSGLMLRPADAKALYLFAHPQEHGGQRSEGDRRTEAADKAAARGSQSDRL